jgi:3-hydroxy-9,10-secoandrosta-1,3,5(10)-triene-9,17-dione monooxygenase reductase component
MMVLEGVTKESNIRSPVSREDFKRLSSNWATGVAVVTTTNSEGRPFGLTLSSATSLSIDPMQFLVCLDDGSTTLPALRESQVFGINMLSQHQASVSKVFAGKSEDKFAGLNYTLVGGVPAIDGVLAFVRCEVANIVQGGDHKIIIGNVTDIEVNGGDPLIYFRGGYRQIPLAS